MQYLMVVDDPIAAACRDILVMGIVAIALVCLVGWFQFGVRGRLVPALLAWAEQLRTFSELAKSNPRKRSRRQRQQRSKTIANIQRIDSRRELSILLPDLAEE